MTQKQLDATPEKRLFLSIISEYDLKLAICELIDNAIDIWTKSGKTINLQILIDADENQQTISIEDNAGGIEELKLDHVVSPGKTSNDIGDGVIGYFGVGSKRAVVALAQQIAIHSRFKNEKSFTVKLDEHWISDEQSWQLPYSESTIELPVNTTLIELSRLRVRIHPDEIAVLQIQFGEIYSSFLEEGVTIMLNGDIVVPIKFDQHWSFPQDWQPTNFTSSINIENRTVAVEIEAGLINYPGAPDKSYGVFVYCNDRLIARGLTDFSVGFVPGAIGNPHYNISLVRTIVRLRGQSRDMPWDASKSGLNTKHPIFQAIRQSMIDVTKKFAQVSRALQGQWESEVFASREGKLVEEKLGSIQNIPKCYLPKPPATRPKWSQKILDVNAKLVSKKPWSGGLLESVVAVDQISKGVLTQKNRIAFILLDSTVEIAYKEYLANEAKIGIAKFKQIVENRTEVQKEVFSRIKVSTTLEKKVDYYYKLRCDLIHQRATPNITDDQVTEYRAIVEELLRKMFGLRFSLPI